MPKVSGTDNKGQAAPTGRTYDQSVKIPDTGNADTTPYKDPNPGSKILNDQFDKASR